MTIQQFKKIPMICPVDLKPVLMICEQPYCCQRCRRKAEEMSDSSDATKEFSEAARKRSQEQANADKKAAELKARLDALEKRDK